MRTLVIASLALLLSGCVSDPFKSRKVATAPVRVQVPVLPRVQAFPVSGVVQQPGQQINVAPPTSIWKPTVIAHIKTDAYVDENNVLWKPTDGYVVLQQGGWDLDAVRRGNTYVPPENSIKPMNLPGLAYGSSTVVKLPQADAMPLFDVAGGDVLYTNLLKQEDEPQARSMAGDGKVAVFDPRLGWLIVPQAVAKAAVSTTIKLPPEPRPVLPRAQAPGPQADGSQPNPGQAPAGPKKFSDL